LTVVLLITFEFLKNIDVTIGSSVTVTQCLGCENLRKCPEAFYDRSIPIDTNDDGADEDQVDSEVNWISKCLSNESYLNENSKYMCDKCQSKQEAKIHTQYTQMPNILILHLLSYGITSSVDGNLNAQKLSNRSRLVNYFDYTSISREPIQRPGLKMDWVNSPIGSKIKFNHSISSKHHFTLFAVVMHSGTTLNSGHYTAFVNYKIISQSISATYSSKLIKF
jgi:ubiquitin carboxyl-terminal hydrolase 1